MTCQKCGFARNSIEHWIDCDFRAEQRRQAEQAQLEREQKAHITLDFCCWLQAEFERLVAETSHGAQG